MDGNNKKSALLRARGRDEGGEARLLSRPTQSMLTLIFSTPININRRRRRRRDDDRRAFSADCSGAAAASSLLSALSVCESVPCSRPLLPFNIMDG